MNKKLYIHKNLPEMYKIDVTDENQIYVEVSGNKNGTPVFFLHGGPGGHCRSDHHRLFNPEKYKSIIFDQRGCGKSTPFQSLKGNNTNSLVEDIEIIRKFLNLNKIMIVGGSWGATLALVYAQTYPENVLNIVLRSVFLGTMDEISWAFLEGPKIFAPELYKLFLSYLEEEERNDPIQSFTKRIHEKNSLLHSWIWHDYERILSQLNPDKHKFDDEKDILNRKGKPNSPFMETFYIQNNFFLSDNQILNNVNRINHIPGLIVQGRYDLICPPINAYNLNQLWVKSSIKLVNTAGHSSSDLGITENLVDCIDSFVDSQ